MKSYRVWLLTLIEESSPQPGFPDWASVGAEVFAGVGVVLLGPPGLEQQVGAAGWWVLRIDHAGQEPCVAVAPPVSAAQWAGQASAVVGLLEVSGQGLPQMVSAAAGTVASEFQATLPDFAEESLDQKKVSGLEELLDLVAVAELVLG